MSDVLAEIDAWKPDTVAVGVTDADATMGTHGPTDTVLPFASVTKTLTTYAVLIAVQDRLVHLDEPAGPADVDVPEGITVRHLLAHASGLPLDPGGPIGVPERRRIYSNWGYDLLGGLVADRVGVPFADHLDAEVLRPLGMDATVLDGSPGHGARGTVRDLLTFARELLDPELLDDELYREATTVAFPGLVGVVPGFGRQTPCDWGLGFEIKGEKDPHWTGHALAPATFGHFGEAGSYLWVDPTRDLACVTLADLAFGDWAKDAWPGFNDRIVATYGG